MDTLLQKVAASKTGQTSISGADRGPSRDASRLMLYPANEVIVTPETTSALSAPTLPGTGTATLTLGGTPFANDAVSLVAQNGHTVAAAVTAGAAAGDTAADVASALATAINAQATLKTWLTVSVAGSVITLTGLTSAVLTLGTAVGNIGTRYTEVDRKIRQIQVDLWAPSDVQRTALGRLMDSRFAYLDSHFGLQGVGGTTDDGTWVRVRDLSDQFVDTDVFRGLYRWMWYLTLEYPQTYAESLYSVLVFGSTFEVDTPSGSVTLP